MSTALSVHDGVAVITIDHPPVNALSHAVRSALADAIGAAERDPRVTAIVLIGARGGFSAGADITEFGTPRALAEPHLRSLLREVERCETPIIAALAGNVMGGGLELALACHYRVATHDAALALPEVRIGLLPGAGGTQRLPRAVGLEMTTEMILTGTPRPARALAALPGQRLLDAVIDEPQALLDAALRHARAVATARPLPRLRDRAVTHENAEAFIAFARTTLTGSAATLPAPGACLDCLAASARLPFDEGLEYERRRFMELMVGPESRALRHAFFAERAAGRVDGIDDDVSPRTVSRVGIVGAGTMGTGIAMAVLAAGLPVILVDTSAASLDRGVRTIRDTMAQQVTKGRLTAAAMEERLAALAATTTLGDLHSVDLVIEAVFEELELKQALFRALDAIVPRTAVLATNTSSLDVDAIAAATSRPGDVVGMHFFSPAHLMKLLEVVRGRATSPAVLATALAVGKRLRKTSVVARNADGFIGNRLFQQYTRQACFLLDEGATPQQVDAAMERFGMAMGPFRVLDLAGNDIGWAIRKRRAVEQPTLVYSAAPDRLCEAGRFGQKVGAGWYDYAPGRRDAIPSDAVAALLAEHRRSIGITPRVVSDAEIVERLTLALINEGACVLDEGIAARASDIDVVYLTGYGFPAWRGGPMHYADTVGVWSVVRMLERLARSARIDAAAWTPAPLLERLVDSGETLTGARA